MPDRRGARRAPPRAPAPSRRARVDQRPQPQAGGHEARALRPRASRAAAPALRFVMLAHLGAGERGERHRLGIGPRAAAARPAASATPRACGEHRAAEQSADASLVGRHAVRREALHVLDVLVAFAAGEPHVGGGDIVLQVDERLAGAAVLPRAALSGVACAIGGQVALAAMPRERPAELGGECSRGALRHRRRPRQARRRRAPRRRPARARGQLRR